MFKKGSLLSLVMLFVVFAAIGCGDSEDVGSEAGGENNSNESKDQLTIGFSQPTLQSPFYVALVEAAKAEAANQGIELLVMDAQENIEKQNNDVIDLITRGIDILVLNPTNPTAVAPALEAAEREKVPVITVDRPTEEDVVAFIGRDNKEMGRLAGEAAIKLLGGEGGAEGKIIEIQGDAGGKVMMDRRDGFHEVVDKEKGIEVVQSPYSDYVRAKAVNAFLDLIEAHPDVDLVYAHNDDMALGALQVLEQKNMVEDVKIVGIDGLTEAVKEIVDGRYDATVLNDPEKLGQLVVETAIKVHNGEQVPDYIDGGTGLIDPSNATEYFNTEKVFAEMKEGKEN